MKVRLFAGLRERAGADAISLELPEGACVRDALERVTHLTNGLPVVMAVNREYAQAGDRLGPGDELALIPPVSGGAETMPGEADETSPGAADETTPTRVHIRLTTEALAIDALLERVRDPRAGAVTSFLGVTREVAALEYEAYPEMAIGQLEAIVSAAIAEHGLCAAAAEHRTGTVPLSEPSVAIAVSAPHRDAAFAGARQIIDQIKALAPIWKKEEGEWVDGTTPG